MGQVDRLKSVPNKSRKSQGSGDWNPRPCDILYLSKAIESDEGGDTVELKMIAFGCDHGGVDLKDTLVGYLRSKGVDVPDFGMHGREAVDYPDFGKEVPYCVSASDAERGVLVCISGIGMSIIANKFLGARSSREHNDTNILVLSGAKTEAILAQQIIEIWLATPFARRRHQRRVDKISQIESRLAPQSPQWTNQEIAPRNYHDIS